MLQISSREYKLLVDHRRCDDGDGPRAIWDEIEFALATVAGVKTKGKLDQAEARRIFFLDTPDHSLRRHGLVLRERSSGDQRELTLKCRGEDRHFVSGTDVAAADVFEAREKLEEDIVPPFLVRFSNSATACLPAGKKADERIDSLEEAARVFPLLGKLRSNGLPCPPRTRLAAVNNVRVTEQVFTGGKVSIARDNSEAKDAKGEFALILWTRERSSTPAIAELSFRLKGGDSGYDRGLALTLREIYACLQRLDSARSGGLTKTEYVYRDGSRD
jgi:hypothetical protein